MGKSDLEHDDDDALAWDQIPPDVRAAIIAEGRNRLFWKNVGAKLGALKGVATVILTLAALAVLLRDAAAAWFLGAGTK